MKKHLFLFISLIVLIAIVISCTKDNIIESTVSENTLIEVFDDVEIEALLEDLFSEIEESGFWADGLKNGRGEIDCKSITVEHPDRLRFPRTITIDFGEGCEIKEGLTKAGKIIIEMSAPHNSAEWTKTIRFDGYSVNGKQFHGGKNITFIREGRGGKPTWQIKSRLKIISREFELQQNLERSRIQIEGFETPRRMMDDAFLISGSSTGINRNGKGYKKTIVEPLHVSKDCKWIKKGVVKIEVRGRDEVILDYGIGRCDDKASITINGETKEITLGKKK